MLTGKIIIVTAPSGSGKTTLVHKLLAACPRLTFSISACTRSPRDGEIDGKDYHFLSTEKFEELIKEDAFVEWEMVYPGKYYGTLKSEVQRIWDENRSPLLDIDVQGAISVQKKYPDNSLSIFIQAPSLEVLQQRLEKRGTETPESLKERVEKARYEMSFSHEFNHIVINDDLETASATLNDIVLNYLEG
ncbi:MAG: guanylate kinase [Bacteroidetes bacterium]|nr:guanylate kinase [Bacteroidota bacterium]